MCEPAVYESKRAWAPILLMGLNEQWAVIRQRPFQNRCLDRWVVFDPFWAGEGSVQFAFGVSSEPSIFVICEGNFHEAEVLRKRFETIGAVSTYTLAASLIWVKSLVEIPDK